MLRAHRLPAVRLRLLFLAAVLSSAIVLALAAGADPSRAAAASLPATGVSVPAAGRAAKAKASRQRSSSARRAQCAAAARTQKARKACAVEKAKTKAKEIRPSASPKPAATAPPSPPSAVPPSILAPAIAGPPPAEALATPAPEPTPPAQSPGGSEAPPVEPEPPVELKAPIKPIAPVEESQSPVEEAKAPVEEAKPPVEEPIPPVEEAKPPVEEPKTPVEAPPIEKASTTTTLASSANPATVGEPVTYTATIGALAATGTIEFEDGGAVIPGCADQAVSFGGATCTVAGYATTGEHTIAAIYSGDGSYLSSTSSALTQAISSGQGGDEDQVAGKKAATTMTLSSSLNPSTVGEAVTYTATPDTAAATGTVEFRQAGVTITGCAARPISAGNAHCTVANPSSGWRLVTAIYSGDSSYANATSSLGLGQSVSKIITTLRWRLRWILRRLAKLLHIPLWLVPRQRGEPLNSTRLGCRLRVFRTARKRGHRNVYCG